MRVRFSASPRRPPCFQEGVFFDGALGVYWEPVGMRFARTEAAWIAISGRKGLVRASFALLQQLQELRGQARLP